MSAKNYLHMGLAILIGVGCFGGCELPYTPEIINAPSDIVVEGYIEAGDQAMPTYVILTKSRPFFQSLNSQDLNDIYVHNALVQVTGAGQTVTLQELCLNDLDSTTREVVAREFGFDPDSLVVNICVYIDLTGQIPGQFGQSYQLFIQTEGKELTATTTIPRLVPLDTLHFDPTPGMPIDSLAQLIATISDPADETNYYRQFIRINSGIYDPGFASVSDDALFNGRTLDFRINSPEDTPDDQPETFGLFHRGDTVSIKWTNIDADHFKFWNTFESSRNSGGPFSSYVRVSTNIQGGLGVWGGYAVTYYQAIVPMQ
ncbi:MAG: DUF4249 domain-containing protein [Saprospiraceae bacterium]|nr:DUF4249 domain-containing protein [Saprospiraceae bacterium]